MSGFRRQVAEGKFMLEKIEQSLEELFQRRHLIALRELALRSSGQC